MNPSGRSPACWTESTQVEEHNGTGVPARALKRAMCLMVASLLAVGCASLERPELTDMGPARGQLTPNLRGGAAFLCPTFEGVNPDASGDPPLNLISLPRADGSSFLLATGVGPSYLCAGVVKPDLTVRGLSLPAEFDMPHQVYAIMAVDTNKGSFIGICEETSPSVLSVSGLTWLDGTNAFVQVTGTMGCTPTLATSADGNDWYSLATVLDVPPGDVPGPDTPIILQLRRFTLDAIGQPAQVGAERSLGTIDASYGRVPWFAEVSEGVFAWVEVKPGSIVHHRSDGAETAEIPFNKSLITVYQAPDTGYLWLLSDDGADIWDAANDVVVGSMPLPPVPAGAAPWVMNPPRLAVSVESAPNPNADWLNVPMAASVAVPSATGYTASQAPTTPCTTRDTCRAVGEMYLKGAVSIGNRPIGVYYAWPWDQSTIVSEILIAPLDTGL